MMRSVSTTGRAARSGDAMKSANVAVTDFIGYEVYRIVRGERYPYVYPARPSRFFLSEALFQTPLKLFAEAALRLACA